MLKIFLPRVLVVTSNLYLRPPSRFDCNNWISVRRASYDFLRPWEPVWQNDALTKAGYTRWFRYAQLAKYANNDIPLLLFHHDDNRLIGGITIKDIRLGHSIATAALGYWMSVADAGKGYMAEAITGLLPHLFYQLNLRRIEAACLPRNRRSRNLLIKLGFSHEGILKQLHCINGVWEDHDIFALLVEHYQQQNPERSNNN